MEGSAPAHHKILKVITGGRMSMKFQKNASIFYSGKFCNGICQTARTKKRGIIF